MSRFVLDASVAIKWFIPEIHSDAAHRLLKRNAKFVVPDVIYPEVGNVLWKRHKRREITADYALAVMDAFARLEMDVCPSASLAKTAVKFALTFGCAVYDAHYVLLAVERHIPLVTADGKLYRSLKDILGRKHLLWIDDVV